MSFTKIAILAAALTLAGCATLPPQTDRQATQALTDTSDTTLGRALAGRVAANPGKNGVYGLNDPHDAFAARGLLCKAAQRSIDTQYYIWAGDQTGTDVRRAVAGCTTGVRVRRCSTTAARAISMTLAA
jgi:putative cardiolipin synthase